MWVLIACGTLAIRAALSPAIIEQVYSNTLYLGVRRLLDGLFGWWPVPASLCVIVVAVAAILRSAWFAWRTTPKSSHSSHSTIRRTGRVALVFLRSGAMIVTAFMLLWGFNYARPGLADHLQLSTPTLTTDELWQQLHETADYVAILRRQLPLSDTSDYSSLPLPQNSELRIRESLQAQLVELGLPAVGRVRTRFVTPGTLLRFKTSGVYFPLTGEAHVDRGLHSLQMPFVMAHEMAHGYGITDEGACNFLAWLACTRAHNLYLRYAGHLTYLRYIGSAVRRRDPENYASFRENLPVGVRADLNSINENLDRFKEIMPEVRDVVYDNYLRSQGVHDGMASYSRIIGLVAAWQREQQVPPAVPTSWRQAPQ